MPVYFFVETGADLLAGVGVAAGAAGVAAGVVAPGVLADFSPPAAAPSEEPELPDAESFFAADLYPSER